MTIIAPEQPEPRCIYCSARLPGIAAVGTWALVRCRKCRAIMRVESDGKIIPTPRGDGRRD